MVTIKLIAIAFAFITGVMCLGADIKDEIKLRKEKKLKSAAAANEVKHNG